MSAVILTEDFVLRSGDISVDTATGYGLDGPGSIPGSANFSLLHSVKTDSEAHIFYYSMGTGVFPRESERQGRESDRSSPSSVETGVGKPGAIPPLPICLYDIVFQ
jgi:hypothetical protein